MKIDLTQMAPKPADPASNFDLSLIQKRSGKIWVYDTEADGLLDTMTHFHCLVFKAYQEEIYYCFVDKKKLTQTYIERNQNTVEQSKVNGRGVVLFFDKTQVKRFLGNTDVVAGLVCHNQLSYDLPAMEKFLGIDYKIGFYENDEIVGRELQIIDTLQWSRSLNPERRLPWGCPAKVYNPVEEKFQTVGAHGLMAWGYRVANMKPEVHDWRNQPLHVYLHRCIEDVKINDKTFTMLRSEANDAALDAGIGLKGSWEECLHVEKYHFHLFAKQERDGAVVDTELMQTTRDWIDTEMQRLAEEVSPKLPLRVLPKSDQPKFPAKPFVNSGAISSTGNKWFEKYVNTHLYIPAEDVTGRAESLRRYQEDAAYRDEWVLKVPMEISNQKDVKEFLATQGWFPTIWNTRDITVDAKKQKYDDTKKKELALKYIAEIRMSPFYKGILKELEPTIIDRKRFNGVDVSAINNWLAKPVNEREPAEKVVNELLLRFILRKGRYLPSTPKFKDQVSGKLCPNLELVDSQIGKDIVRYMSLGNRRSVIQARGEGKTTGWLNNERLKRDGRLGARSSGLTNTHRQTHSVVVNVPKAAPNVLLGETMRSIFKAPDGYYNVGFDAAALENRVGGHFCFPFDGGDYAALMLDGDVHTTMATAYTEAAGFEITRSAGKNVTYATVFGAQAPKIAKMLGVDKAVGQRIWDAFWETNIGLKKVKDALTAYWERTDKKYVVTIDGSKIFTRSQHSLTNCLFQSTGAKICAWAFCWTCAMATKEGLDWQRWGEFHDEMQAYESKDYVQRFAYPLDYFGEPTQKEDGSYEYVLPPMEHSGKIFTKAKLDVDKGEIVQYYSRVGELGVQGVRLAGEHFKMNIPLDADYMVGENWKECH